MTPRIAYPTDPKAKSLMPASESGLGYRSAAKDTAHKTIRPMSAAIENCLTGTSLYHRFSATCGIVGASRAPAGPDNTGTLLLAPVRGHAGLLARRSHPGGSKGDAGGVGNRLRRCRRPDDRESQPPR